MKKSKVEAAQTRKRILEAATQTFKVKGIHATGVAEIMASAGLSHGGFYRHFESKEQLIAEVMAANMSVLVDATSTRCDGNPDAFVKHLEDSLSVSCRDDRQGGCPLAAMGSELVRAEPEARHAATKGIQALIDVLAQSSPPSRKQSAEDNAIFTLSAVLGAVTMARIVNEPALSERFLEVMRQRLLSQPELRTKKLN